MFSNFICFICFKIYFKKNNNNNSVRHCNAQYMWLITPRDKTALIKKPTKKTSETSRNRKKLCSMFAATKCLPEPGRDLRKVHRRHNTMRFCANIDGNASFQPPADPFHSVGGGRVENGWRRRRIFSSSSAPSNCEDFLFGD